MLYHDAHYDDHEEARSAAAEAATWDEAWDRSDRDSLPLVDDVPGYAMGDEREEG